MSGPRRKRGEAAGTAPRRSLGRAALGLAGLVLAALTLAAPSAFAQAKLYHSRESALRIAFAESESFQPVPLNMDPALVNEIGLRAKVEAEFQHTECYQGMSGGEVRAYACIDNMLGHERYITYLLRIEHPAGTVAFLEIMHHRESVGNLTHYPHFLRRFPGKTVADQVWNGRDVPLISGATQSCEALTGGTRKLLRLYDLYLKYLPKVE